MNKEIMLSHIVTGIIVSQFNLFANEDVTNLDEVLVTSAAGYTQKLINAPASISVITQEELQKIPYTNLLDAVKDIEGVDVGQTISKTGLGGISIRGMGSEYTLILIDGKRQNSIGGIFPNNVGDQATASIPPISMIERIEVIRGPMSTLYGSDAIGGVVNIITKKISNEWVGSFSQSQTFQTDSQFGNDTTSNFALLGPIIKDVLGISLSGSYFDKAASLPQITQELNDSFSAQGGKEADNQNWSSAIGLTFTPNEDHTIKLNYSMAKQKYDNSQEDIGTVDNYEALWTNQRVGYLDVQRFETEQFSLDHEAIWDFGTSTVGIHHVKTNNYGRTLPLNAAQRKLFDDNKQLGGKWDTYEKAMADPNFLSFLPRPTRVLQSKATTFNAQYEMPFEKHYVIVGTEYIDGELEDGVFGISDSSTGSGGVVSDTKQLSLFIEDNWSATDNFTLTTGVRYQDNDSFGGHLSPRMYGVYNLNENWYFKGGVATGYKTPDADMLFYGVRGFGAQGTKPFVGNPDLQPETSISTELAVYYTHEDGHNFNVTIFKNDFKDRIESRNVSGANFLPDEWTDVTLSTGAIVSGSILENVGEATLQGIEIGGKYQILDNLFIRGNYTYLDSEGADNEPFGDAAEHLYNATFDWDVTPKFNTFLRVSGEINRWRGDNDIVSDYYKNFTVFDLGSSYVLAENVTVNARINNLFDTDFTSRTRYLDGNIEENVYDYSISQKRREFWINLQVTF